MARISLYSWIFPTSEEDNGASEETASDSDSGAETPNADGNKELELEDLQLWTSMDLDKDGKLTIGEFERWAKNPSTACFVSLSKISC